MIYIGIDTGVNTGIAIWDNRKRSLEMVTSMPIHKAMDEVRHWKKVAEGMGTKLIVRVEDPRQRVWFGTERMSREDERKRLQGVGSVKRDASIWDAFLKDSGIIYEMVEPKMNTTKISHDGFVRMTGWSKRTNEHSRDAAMLVYGF